MGTSFFGGQKEDPDKSGPNFSNRIKQPNPHEKIG
jgi:hypothetical protein